MKIELFYFSGTGNTKVISEEIKKRIDTTGHHTCQLKRIEKADPPKDSINGDILGIGYPVYDYLPPEIVWDFVKALPPVKDSKPVFLFSTYSMGPLDVNAHCAKVLQEKGYVLIGHENFKAPAPSLFLFADPENSIFKNNAKYGKGIVKRIDDFSDLIIHAAQGETYPCRIPFHPLNKIMQKISYHTFGYYFYRNLKRTDQCVNCGLCAASCPAEILKMENGTLTIENDGNCLRCLRCHQVCQKQGIHFTSARRRGDFGINKSRELFDEVY